MIIILIVRIAIFITFVAGMITLAVNVRLLRKVGKKTDKEINTMKGDIVTVEGRVTKIETRVTTLENKYVTRTVDSDS